MLPDWSSEGLWPLELIMKQSPRVNGIVQAAWQVGRVLRAFEHWMGTMCGLLRSWDCISGCPTP